MDRVTQPARLPGGIPGQVLNEETGISILSTKCMKVELPICGGRLAAFQTRWREPPPAAPLVAVEATSLEEKKKLREPRSHPSRSSVSCLEFENVVVVLSGLRMLWRSAAALDGEKTFLCSTHTR